MPAWTYGGTYTAYATYGAYNNFLMDIIGAHWTKVINMLHIHCDCGATFSHRADRWRVICRVCGIEEYLGNLRETYQKENNDE